MAMGRSSGPPLREPFVERRGYVLSRPLRISAPIGLGLAALWLGLLLRRGRRASLDRGPRPRARKAGEHHRRLVAEARGGRPAGPEGARTARGADGPESGPRACARACPGSRGEAGELGRKLALAKDQIRELKCDRARGEAAARPMTRFDRSDPRRCSTGGDRPRADPRDCSARRQCRTSDCSPEQHGVMARWLAAVVGLGTPGDTPRELLENRADAVCRFGCLPQDDGAVRGRP
jgi:hypothetical protein